VGFRTVEEETFPGVNVVMVSRAHTKSKSVLLSGGDVCEHSRQVRAQLEFGGAGVLRAGCFKGLFTCLCLGEEQPACSLTM